MELQMQIENVKAIKQLSFSFPLESGLYAITGENASGKSTLVACASTVFYNAPMYDYFGRPSNKANIKFKLDDTTREWIYSRGAWTTSSSDKRMKINGFYEGSIIFGNRFRDTVFSALKKLDHSNITDLNIADDFIRTNLGSILHNDEHHYSNLYIMKEDISKTYNLSGAPYFYKSEYNSTLVSQARMSTGENLLISILHSLNIIKLKRKLKNDGRPYIVFLDEIELALHASALRRLTIFLEGFANEYELPIFFSTHSLELIRGIKPQNIFYLSKMPDYSIHVTNPCYPAYATRSLYNDDGYGYDLVIFVEDDVAESIVERILIDRNLINNIRVKILPTGGWTNTLIMARDVISSRLLLKNTKIAIVLDRDIKHFVPDFLSTHPECKNLNINYLPIRSLEKYLKNNLVDNVNHNLYKKLDNYVFQGKPLNLIVQNYLKEVKPENDSDGKSLYGFLINELKGIRRERKDLAEIVIKFLQENEIEKLNQIASFLETIIN